MVSRLAILFWMAALSVAWGDGGRVVGERELDGVRVVLFAQPDPIRAGLVDVGVYLEKEGEPCLDAKVGFRMIKLSAPSPEKAWRGPGCVTPGISVPAVRGHAGNKLMYSAALGIPEAGLWELAVDVSRARMESATFELQVDAPAPPIAAWWPLVLMVPAGVAIYAWRASILSRRGRR